MGKKPDFKKLFEDSDLFKKTIKKDKFNKTYLSGAIFYDWCIKNKIKVEEPLDKKTNKYETFVITLDTPKKHQLFSEAYPKLQAI